MFIYTDDHKVFEVNEGKIHWKLDIRNEYVGVDEMFVNSGFIFHLF